MAARSLAALLAGAAAALPLLGSAACAQTSLGAEEAGNPHRLPQQQRPSDLVVLRRWSTMEGEFVIGVHQARPDPRDPGARSIVVWVESPSEVKLAVDSLRCNPDGPLRLTRQGSRLLIKELNPGGPVTEANRLDHQIWWAACFPELAGQDPASLAAKARKLGFSGQLREQQQVLPANPR